MLYILSYIHNCTFVPTVPPGHQRTIPYCSVFEHFSEPSELIFILALQTDSCVICKSVTDSDWPFESLRGYFLYKLEGLIRLRFSTYSWNFTLVEW